MEASSLRQSRRIANVGGCDNALDRAHTVLMHKLVIILEQDRMTQEACDAYAWLFEHPLSCSHIAALMALFGWIVPNNCEVRSANPLWS